MVDEFQLQALADKIKEELRKGFEEIHLSKNLMDTISVKKTEKGFSIDIPAELYDINLFKKKNVVVYTGKGSYAQLVDQTGGFSGKHIGYVEEAIAKALDSWMKENNIKGRTTIV